MLNIAIVGAGIIGKSHAEAIDKNPDCKLTVVADLDMTKANEMAEKYGAIACTDYKDILKYGKPDAVILNLPHFLHCPVSCYFLNQGVNVLVEKPMALNVAECDAMIEAAEKNHAKLAVGHVQHYFGPFKVIKKIIDEKQLGRLCSIVETRNIDYFKPERPRWFLDKSKAGGGIVMNYCAHTMDKIFYTTGLNAVDVHSLTNNFLSDDTVEASAQVLVELEGGVSAALTFCGCRLPYEYYTEYFFTDGAVKVVNNHDLYVSKNGRYEQVEWMEEDVMDQQIAELVKLIRGEESRIATAQHGRNVIKVLEKIVAKDCAR